MKAAYVKYPFMTEIRDVDLEEPGCDQVLVDIRACGVCGADLVTMSTEGESWQPLGHEIAGVLAVKIAKLMGARKVIVAELSSSPKRIELAKLFGADEVILTDQTDLA